MIFALAAALAFQDVTADQPLSAQVSRPPELQQRMDANPELFTPPTWIVIRTPEWPREAYLASMEGEATLSCVVDSAGRARVCEVLAESPEGAGFGEAALAARQTYRWEAATFDGEPVESLVHFLMPFRFAETAQSTPEIRAVLSAIYAEGYAAGACRAHLDQVVVRRWDALQTQVDERPSATYRAYDRVFIDGYAEGREFAESRADLTSTQCAALRAQANQQTEDAEPALREVEAQMPPSDRSQLRPPAE